MLIVIIAKTIQVMTRLVGFSAIDQRRTYNDRMFVDTSLKTSAVISVRVREKTKKLAVEEKCDQIYHKFPVCCGNYRCFFVFMSYFHKHDLVKLQFKLCLFQR